MPWICRSEQVREFGDIRLLILLLHSKVQMAGRTAKVKICNVLHTGT